VRGTLVRITREYDLSRHALPRYRQACHYESFEVVLCRPLPPITDALLRSPMPRRFGSHDSDLADVPAESAQGC
jgi:hypothetical protein